MGVRENDVENYLHEQVEKLGGTTRKWTSPGRSGVPDRIVIIGGDVLFIEVKTESGKLSGAQMREMSRLQEHKAMVGVVYGHKGVDRFIQSTLIGERGHGRDK